MSVLNLEDVIVEVATGLALTGECDIPVDNYWGGVDLVAPGYYELRSRKVGGLCDGVRISIEDSVVHIWKFESHGVAAHATFAGSFSSLSSILTLVAKEWLAN